MTRHLLDITDLTRVELAMVLDIAAKKPDALNRPLLGRGVALIFEKPSNRTRHSAEMAVVQLGGHPVYTRGEEIGFDVRESVEDVTRILCGYHSIIAARVHSHRVLERMKAVSDVPVVNMLSDLSHPLQALADLVTMKRHCGPIENLSVAWVGDYNNVARSLAQGVSLLGGSINLACPTTHGCSTEEISHLESLGGRVRQFVDPEEAVLGVDVVHTDTWISMGQENDAEMRRQVFAQYRVTMDLMSRAKPNAKFMHCMPAHRGEEVEAEVFDGPASLVIPQGHARLDSARAAFAYVIGERS